MRVIDQVENLLKASRKARNSDTELLILYMQRAGMNLSPAQIEKFRELPSMETIRRSRQLLQEKGLYQADEAVQDARYEKYKAMKGHDYYTPGEVLEHEPVQPPAKPILLSKDSEEYKVSLELWPD